MLLNLSQIRGRAEVADLCGRAEALVAELEAVRAEWEGGDEEKEGESKVRYTEYGGFTFF